MQIFHWLLKLAQEREKRDSSTTSTSTKHKFNYQEPKGKDIDLFKHSGSERRSERGKGKKFGSRNFRAFPYLCRKDVATACFYSTLSLRRLNSLNRRHHMKMKKEDTDKGQIIISDKVESTTQGVGNKVLPVNDTSLSSSTSTNDQCDPKDKVDKLKGDKVKAMSRMKELLRWAAAAKSEKKGKFMGRKVLQFRNRAMIKAVREDEEDKVSSESPKISFRWESESCSSVCSDLSMASSKTDISLSMLSLNSTSVHHRKGNWITTDSEFVVLEL